MWNRRSLFTVLLFGWTLSFGLSVLGQQEAPSHQAVSVRFKGMVGEAPVSCTSTYEGIGTSGSTIALQDFKFYVHNVRLVTLAGTEVPVVLEQDGRWQRDDVALLDFEDGTGSCANGGPELRDIVTGRVPQGDYGGLKFTLGVPFDKNHRDPVAEASPLNLSRMFWSWNGGYKFLRLDFTSTGLPQGHLVHLGSTNCVPNQTRITVPTACARPNRVDVAFSSFDPARDIVVADVKQLLAANNVDVNTPDTPAGCMSAPGDPECPPLFGRLGLPIGDLAASVQSFFRPVPGAESSAGGFRWDLPPSFPTPRVPDDNPMSAAKVELGRHLFYDTRLSVNGTYSCASCHEQAKAFTDGKGRAVGATGEVHPRGSMSLANIAYSPVLTWGNPLMRDLERQALVPMMGEVPVELGLAGQEKALFARLAAQPQYQALFPKAFPDDATPISLGNITKAIASFERTMISGRSPYDRYQFGGDRTAISEGAKRGETLFFDERTECFHCHGGFNFTETVDYVGKQMLEIEFHNTGLYNIGRTGAYPGENTGVHSVTGRAADMGRFKAPTLRNIAVTAPYMHDGSIATLDEVLDHYMAGGRTVANGPNAGMGRNNPLKSAFVKGFTLTPQEKRDLVEFLRSLTDPAFLADPRLSNPWSTNGGLAATNGS